MNIKRVTSTLISPRVIAPIVFLGVGSCKTMLDYDKAPPENKKQILAKDISILLGALAGFLLINPVTKRICPKTNFHKNLIEDTEYIITQTIAGVLNTLSGIIGATIGGALANKYLLNKDYFNQPQKNENLKIFKYNLTKQSDVFQKFNYINKPASQTASAIMSLPSLSQFNAPMIALTGMSVAKTEGYNNKIKKTAKELIANSLIPTFLVSATSLAVNNKKNYIKYPALLTSLGLGSYLGNILSEKCFHKIDKTIDTIDFQNINFKQKLNNL